ncbi:cytosolic protein [Thalassobacillus sp. CUG 92003]|uniref:cytosolic protein n=1 Tax=Thalassobacillus sp. CUG 92003 TaxID=2736641 RepID=UPI0015E6F5C8
MKKFISTYLSNHSETAENHWDPKLETHYFKTTKDKAFSAVETMLNRSPSRVISVSKEHGEINVHYQGKRKAFIVASVIMVRPFRTAVDFSVTTESGGPVDFGFSKKLISQFYEQLNKELPRVEYKNDPLE